MHTLILAAAGLSTRFSRPKWSLTHPSGNIMLAESIRNISGYDRLILVMRKEHVEYFGKENIRNEMHRIVSNVEIFSLERTDSQAETVARTLATYGIGELSSFTVKDCDNTFNFQCVSDMNLVAVVDLQTFDYSVIAKNKSYVLLNYDGSIIRCVEKQVVSNLFCCGAYSFSSARTWWDAYRSSEHKFISQIVDASQEKFGVHPVDNYEDWGTEDDWTRFCSKFVTLFVDIDGVLVKSSHRSFDPRWGTTPLIEENVEVLNNLKKKQRAYIILTTSRSEDWRTVTENQVATVMYDQLIMGLPACRRILINDTIRAGHDTAQAVNLIRNTAELKGFL